MEENALKEKLNEKYILYQMLAQNLEALKQQLELVEQQMIELRSTSMSIDDLKKLGEQNEIFLPLASGCFGRGSITDSKKILVGIGAGIFMEKTSVDAKAFVERNFREVEKAGLEIEGQMKNIVGQMNVVAAELQDMAQREGQG